MSSLNRKMKRNMVKNNPGVFRNKGYIYSISSKNKYGEYVVIKMHENEGEVKIIDTRIVKARTVQGVQKQIDTIPFENFIKFDENKGLH